MSKMIKSVDELKRGDIVVYRNGRINYVNRPIKYANWFKEDFKSLESPLLDIVEVKRYVKILWFYKLKTIYKRKEN